MLVWTDRGRRIAVGLVVAVLVVVVAAPPLVVVVSSFARTWNGVLPTGLTLEHLRAAVSADNLASLSVSIRTALAAGLTSVLVGTCAAVSVRRLPTWCRTIVDTVFALPVAVPSVVVGIGLLVAFSRRPILLNGSAWIVIAAQTTLVLAFAYSTVSAALQRLDPSLTTVAGSLGARPTRILVRITLPLLLPAITAGAALAVALCMGELGATIMVYPPTWRTLPVSIFALSDRGRTLDASAETLVQLIVTGMLLLVIGRIRVGARRRRR